MTIYWCYDCNCRIPCLSETSESPSEYKPCCPYCLSTDVLDPDLEDEEDLDEHEY